MANRSIFVTLGLKTDGFQRGASDAAAALGKVTAAGDDVGRKGSRGLKDFGRQLQENRQEAQLVGAGMVAVGGTMLALTTKVAKTGIEYNVLQQNSRAALKTLLGGAEAANAQMDKLDAFAKTSPFSKAVFIDAQRQMIGFGIETAKVIPYLDAIQNATAAIGGSNNDIAAISEIFAKIQSQGKITARELMMLGGYGIDAATLIGDAMGKTADQIRADITAGALDAGTALDALAEGMQGRFGGAAEAIKEQFTGALDRVKAAFRDFSSAAMEPFVSAQGGGLLVDWTNSLADAIRWMDKMPQSAKTATVVIGGVGGAALTAAGTFLILAPRIMDTVDALNRMKDAGGALGGLASGVGKFGRALGAAGVVLAALKIGDQIMNSFRALPPEIEKTTAALLGIKEGGKGIDTLFADIGQQTRWAQFGAIDIWNMTDAMDALLNPSLMDRANDFAGTVMSFGSRAGRVERDAIIRQFDMIGESLAEMVSSGNGDRAAAIYRDIEDAWVGAGGSLEDLNNLMPAYGSALDAVANDAELAAGGQDAFSDATGGAAAAAVDATAAYEGYLAALQGLVDFQDGLVNSFLAGRSALRDYTAAQEEFSEVTEMTEEILDGYAEGQRKNIRLMSEATDANGDRVHSEEELAGMMQTTREQIIETARAMGLSKGKAELLADSYGLIPEEISTWIAAQDDASQVLAEIMEALDGLPPETIAMIRAYGGDEAIEVAGAVASAIEDGIPPEYISELLAVDRVSESAELAKATIESVHERWVSELEAVDGVTDVARHATRELEDVPDVEPEINAQDGYSKPSDDATRKLEGIPDVDPKITAVDNATSTIGRIVGALAAVQSKTVTVGVRYTSSGSTDMGRTTSFAFGGPVFGPGTPTSDSVPALLSRDEHVATAREVYSLGGHGVMFALRQAMVQRPQDVRAAIGFADGGTPAMSAPRFASSSAGFGGQNITVIVNDHSRNYNPVAVPHVTQQRERLQQASALVKGLV